MILGTAFLSMSSVSNLLWCWYRNYISQYIISFPFQLCKWNRTPWFFFLLNVTWMPIKEHYTILLASNYTFLRNKCIRLHSEKCMRWYFDTKHRNIVKLFSCHIAIFCLLPGCRTGMFPNPDPNCAVCISASTYQICDTCDPGYTVPDEGDLCECKSIVK